MSKAEEEANKRYGITRGDDTQETSGIDMQRASDFIEGYEQAEKDIYEWLEENAASFVGLADNEHPAIGDTKAFYGTKSLIHYLKQAIEDEKI